MSCALCATRKPQRFCPAVPGDICTVCCASSREQTLNCPVDCEHLLRAHEHETAPPLDAKTIPNQDIAVSESFLADNEWVLVALMLAFTEVARACPDVNDWDARDALESLIRTYRTLQSGLYYESKPVNPRAGQLFVAVQKCVADIRHTEANARGMATLRDAAVLGILVFLERLERAHNNGKPRCRVFLASLSQFGPPDGNSSGDMAAPGPGLIL